MTVADRKIQKNAFRRNQRPALPHLTKMGRGFFMPSRGRFRHKIQKRKC